MMTTTQISVNDWFVNKYSNADLLSILYDFADALDVRTKVTDRDGRCTIANELERMESIEADRNNWKSTNDSLV